MNTLIVLVALSGQFRYSGDVGTPAPRESAAVAEPFPARALPAELRAPAPNLLPLPDHVFAPEPLPALPDQVFAPAPRRRIIRVASQDAPAPNPSPTPGIRRPEAEEALLRRLADVEHRVDELERARTMKGAAAQAKVAAAPCPMGCPSCEVACKTPGECGHPGCWGALPAAAKRWRGIVGEPGVEGFGALNAKGEIVVERRRVTAQPVATYATYQEPVTYQQPVLYQQPVTFYGAPYGGGFVAGSVCGPGGCGVSARGLLGGLFR